MIARALPCVAVVAAFRFIMPQTVAAMPTDSLSRADSVGRGTALSRERILPPTIVTGQAIPVPLSATPMKMRVLDAQRIADQQAVTLRDVLQNELATRLSQDNVLGTSLSMQGVGGQNVKILVDGVPVIGRLDGAIDLGQIPLANAERIEIVDGPMSTLYGTDALGGVINVITRPAAPNLHAEATLYGETVGNANANVRLSGGSEAVSTSLNVGRLFFAGWRPDTDPSTRAFQWKPREQYLADADVRTSFGGTTLRATHRYYSDFILNRGEPRAPYRESAFDDEYRTLRNTSSVDTRHTLGSGLVLSTLTSASFYRRTKNTLLTDLVTLNRRPTSQEGDQDTNRMSAFVLRGTLAGTHGLRWDAGYDVTLEDVTGRRITGGQATQQDVAVFGSVQYYPMPTVLLQPSVRAAWNSNYGAPVTPTLAIRVDAADNVTIRTSIARGFRAPSLREVYLEFVDINHDIRGNTGLDAERSTNVQAAVQWSPPVQGSALRIEPSVFFNDITNMITLSQVRGQLYSYVNVGRFRSVGGVVDATWITTSLEVAAGASVTWRSRLATADAAVSSLAAATEARLRLQWATPVEHVRLSAFYKFTGPLPILTADAAGQTTEGRVDGWHSLDATIGYADPALPVDVSLGLRNLFDVRNIAATIAAGTAHSSSGGSQAVATGRTVSLLVSLRLP